MDRLKKFDLKKVNEMKHQLSFEIIKLSEESEELSSDIKEFVEELSKFSSSYRDMKIGISRKTRIQRNSDKLRQNKQGFYRRLTDLQTILLQSHCNEKTYLDTRIRISSLFKEINLCFDISLASPKDISRMLNLHSRKELKTAQDFKESPVYITVRTHRQQLIFAEVIIINKNIITFSKWLNSTKIVSLSTKLIEVWEFFERKKFVLDIKKHSPYLQNSTNNKTIPSKCWNLEFFHKENGTGKINYALREDDRLGVYANSCYVHLQSFLELMQCTTFYSTFHLNNMDDSISCQNTNNKNVLPYSICIRLLMRESSMTLMELVLEGFNLSKLQDQFRQLQNNSDFTQLRNNLG